MRKITLSEAQAKYVHRFTMEHVPNWARLPMPNGKYPRPQYRSDQEWYDSTSFPGEDGIPPRSRYCLTRNQTWPVGMEPQAEPYRN